MTFSKNTLIDLISLSILIACAACLIFYKFPSIPYNISTDEADFILLAKSLDGTKYAPYSQMATGHATLYFYILLLSIKLFGETIFAVRFPSAIFGVIDTILVFFCFKLIFSYLNKTSHYYQKALTFISTFTFLTLRWYFNFARFGFEATTILFFELLGIICLLLYLQNKKSRYLLLTGIFSGLSYNSYTPGRIFFIIPTLILLWNHFQGKFKSVEITKQILTFFVPFIILIFPLNFYFSKNTDNRIYEQFFLQSERLTIEEKSSFLFQNIKSISGMFIIKGDPNGRHNYPDKPLLNPILGILFFLGLIKTIIDFKKFPNSIFLLYFAVGLLPPLLTYPWENPNSLRAITVIPSVIYFISQGIFLITHIKKLKKIALIGVFILIGLSAVYEIRTYFVFQTKVFPISFELDPDLLEKYLDGSYIYKSNQNTK